MLAGKIAFIGAGTMGRAVLDGLLDTQTVQPQQCSCTSRSPKSQAELRAAYAASGVHITTDNVQAITDADIVVLGVKPFMIEDLVLAAPVAAAIKGKFVFSLAAGITLPQLQAWMPHSPIMRVMPNTPCKVRKGLIILTPFPTEPKHAFPASMPTELFQPLCIRGPHTLPESTFDIATSLAGSGPAYALLMLEAMADAGVAMGLTKETSVELAAGAMQGATCLALEKQGDAQVTHPGSLRDKITTPGGCTIAGLLKMEDHNIRSGITRGVMEGAYVARGGMGKK